MADELELDVVEGKKSNVVLIIAVMAISLLIGGAAAWFFVGGSGGSKSAKAEEEILPLQYLTLTPEFVVNFPPNKKVRYLQIDLQIATRSTTALDDMLVYNPVIRNDILIILSSLSYDELSTLEGKAALQKKILNVINKVLSSIAHEGSPKKRKKKKDKDHDKDEHTESDEIIEGPIENVYFTSFIMQ